ncbi:MAG TPA: hypothetical protein VK638_26300 [Edaphobacter sp.]|nr:hypothetical protein [Edaphobacter sp.]
MLKKLNSTLIIALCTSAALIAFAFYERYEASGTVPAVAFYCAAAVICLLPALYALLRHKICRNKMLNIS